jgi:hypothetical protein
MNVVPDSLSLRGGLVLLAPQGARVADSFNSVSNNLREHQRLLISLQKLRGELYLADGAIQNWQLSPGGRHRQSSDEHAWHVVAVNHDGEVFGCSRYTPYSNATFSRLGVRKSPLALSAEWSLPFREAIESDLALAKHHSIDFVEVGGWALAPEYRCSAEALRIALATYSLARLLGGCIGIGTVTRRHCSASILRRIGGQSLNSKGLELPRYFDPQYGCDMEVLRFDSSRPNPRYEPWIRDLGHYLQSVPVICRATSGLRLTGSLVGQNRGLRESSDISSDLLQAV